MGHSWDILAPSCLTLSKRAYMWDKYQGTLIFNIGHFRCMHMTLRYTIEELKGFENAGCALLYDGLERAEWSCLYKEIKDFNVDRLTYDPEEPTIVMNVNGQDIVFHSI